MKTSTWLKYRGLPTPAQKLAEIREPSSRRRAWHHCKRCGAFWLGRMAFKGDWGKPKRCAACRSPLWDTERKNEPGQGRRRFPAG